MGVKDSKALVLMKVSVEQIQHARAYLLAAYLLAGVALGLIIWTRGDLTEWLPS